PLADAEEDVVEGLPVLVREEEKTRVRRDVEGGLAEAVKLVVHRRRVYGAGGGPVSRVYRVSTGDCLPGRRPPARIQHRPRCTDATPSALEGLDADAAAAGVDAQRGAALAEGAADVVARDLALDAEGELRVHARRRGVDLEVGVGVEGELDRAARGL